MSEVDLTAARLAVPRPADGDTPLERLRVRYGSPSYRELRDRVAILLGEEHTPSAVTIRSYHLGEVSHEQPLILWALAYIYDIPLADLSPAAAKVMKTVAELGIPSSACFTDRARLNRRGGDRVPA